MLRRSTQALITIAFAFALGSGAQAATNLTGTWQGVGGAPGIYAITQSGSSITWYGHASDGHSWANDYTGTINANNDIVGTFQDRPGFDAYQHGSVTVHIVDNCHLAFVSASVPWGTSTWTKENCQTSTQPATTTTTTAGIKWPPLPVALVPIETVSNGCGGGPAGTEAKYGDDSDFVNSEIPFADLGSWERAKKYHVNFREACKLHDAGYSHAKVRDDLNGGVIVDFFNWTKAEVDNKFLKDMIKICDEQIPKEATVALNNCKHNGGFHTVSGAQTRYDIVAATTYTQYLGVGFYQEPPKLTDAWTVSGLAGQSPWSIEQSGRLVTAGWTAPAAGTNVQFVFRGRVISHDADSTIEGFYVAINNGIPSAARAMTFRWSPTTPDALRVTGGTSSSFSLER